MKLVCTVTCNTARADLVFVLDSSGSIRDANPADESYDNWNLVLQFMANFVDRLPVDQSGSTLANVRVGLVRYVVLNTSN